MESLKKVALHPCPGRFRWASSATMLIFSKAHRGTETHMPSAGSHDTDMSWKFSSPEQIRVWFPKIVSFPKMVSLPEMVSFPKVVSFPEVVSFPLMVPLKSGQGITTPCNRVRNNFKDSFAKYGIWN